MARVFVSAGEASGDMHGAELARALRARHPAVDVFGMGGAAMQAADVDIVLKAAHLGTVGFAEALRNYGELRRGLRSVVAAMDARPPDVVVCIDFPGFNMKLAAAARRRNIPVVYFFSPSAWAWGRNRAQRLARLGITVCAVFPFEARVYEDAGADVVFVGHPAVERVVAPRERDVVRRGLGLAPEQPLVALLPGSREQELRRLLPVMLEAAAIIGRQKPEARFVLPVAHTVSAQQVKAFLPAPSDVPLIVLEGRTYDMMQAADAGLIGMGTATLEAALLRLPHVACYRLSALTYFIARRLVHVDHYALPNIIAGREIVPEIVQSHLTAPNLARSLLALLKPERGNVVREQLDAVRAALGEPGAVGRVADVVLAKAEANRRAGVEQP